MRAVVAVLLSPLCLSACFGLRAHGHPERPATIHTLTLVGQSSVPSLVRVPAIVGLPFGGLSGLAMTNTATELLGISDAQQGGRVYRFTIEGVGGELRITPTNFIPLQMVPGNFRPDHESLAVLPNGDLLVASEGSGREPRLPPAIAEYGPYGEFMRLLPLRDRYVPDQTGPLTHGARGNAGFESLTLSPDGGRLFTAVETALVQDGEPASFTAGARTRILEYVAKHGTYEPVREFAYDVERLDKPPFEPGTIFINGLVDLLALNRTTLLALERSYVEDAANPTRNINCIRVYQVALSGATDISRIDSLKDHPEVVPVTKTLLLDLAKVQGLNPQLVGTLDNFEGMTFGPLLPDGRPTLLLVSDDNFNESQHTWFLLFAIQ